MQIITKALPMTHRIYAISDTHEGTILKHKAGIRKVVKMIMEDPNAYVIHLGDLAEAITIDDKRYCIDTVDPDTSLPLLQYQAVVKEFWDIRDRFITILEGNHDAKIAGKYGNFVRDYVCKELGVPYGTYTSRITINDTKARLQYKIYAAHGRRMVGSTADDPTRKIANEKLQLKRHLRPMATDCAVMMKGHTHKLIVKEPETELCLVDDGKKIHQKYTKLDQTSDFIHPDLRWYVNTGCFYKLHAMGVSGYAERAEYPPNELGFAIIDVVDGQIRSITPKMI